MHDLVTMARSFIYDKAIPITGAAVEDVLKSMSLVPTLVRETLAHSLQTDRTFLECIL
jgi:hypothetical protein